MKMTVLVENTASEELGKEWGLSILAEYNGKQFLLDTGASSLFLDNANKLHIDIAKVDYGILSHAHFDHACGMPTFFDVNKTAPFFISRNAEENCYSGKAFFPVYIGMKKGMLKKYSTRICRVKEDYKVSEGVYIIPHKLPPKDTYGAKKERMYVRRGWHLYPDKFEHEQSVVFRSKEGLVVVNGCCHSGVDHVIKEIQMTFPNEKIAAIVGGFHTYSWSDEEVLALAKRLKKLEVTHIYTGHCTGKHAYKLLADELSEKVEALTTGKVFSFQ